MSSFNSSRTVCTLYSNSGPSKTCSQHSNSKVPEKKKLQLVFQQWWQKKKRSFKPSRTVCTLYPAVPEENAAQLPTAKSQKSSQVTFKHQIPRRACRSRSNNKVSEEHARCIPVAKSQKIMLVTFQQQRQKIMLVTFQKQSLRRRCGSHSNSKVPEEHASRIPTAKSKKSMQVTFQ